MEKELIRVDVRPPPLSEESLTITREVFNILLREPNAPLYLYLKGYKKASCRNGFGGLNLYASNGYHATFKDCLNVEGEYTALAPARSPLLEHGLETFVKLLTGSNLDYVVTDTYLLYIFSIVNHYQV